MNNLAINPSVAFGTKNYKTNNNTETQERPKTEGRKNNALAAGALGVTVVGLGVAGFMYRKNIAKFATNLFNNVKTSVKNLFKKNDEIGDLRKMYSSKTKIENQKHLDFLNTVGPEADIARQKELAKMHDEAFDVFSRMPETK